VIMFLRVLVPVVLDNGPINSSCSSLFLIFVIFTTQDLLFNVLDTVSRVLFSALNREHPRTVGNCLPSAGNRRQKIRDHILTYLSNLR